MPIPRPIGLQFALWAAEASRRGGNHSSGAHISLPSESRTRSISSSQRTSVTKAKVLRFGPAEVPMPSLHEHVAMLDNQAPQPSKFNCIISDGPGQGHGVQPELGVVLSRLDMDVGRLVAFSAEEEEPVTAKPEYCRHQHVPGEPDVSRPGPVLESPLTPTPCPFRLFRLLPAAAGGS